MNSQVWLPVVDWESLYEVSDHGRVYSVRTDTILRPYTTQRGHKAVKFSVGGNQNGFYVHILVAEAFLGLRPPGMEVCHNDGDPTNNRADNLRWDTPSNNQLDKVKHGNNHFANKTHCPQGHEYTEENTVYFTQTHGGKGRICRMCKKEQNRKQRLKRKGVS